jgi:hypothetical protein
MNGVWGNYRQRPKILLTASSRGEKILLLVCFAYTLAITALFRFLAVLMETLPTET